MKEFRYRAIVKSQQGQQMSISFCAESKALAWDHAHRLTLNDLPTGHVGSCVRVNRILKNDDHDFGVFKPC